MSAIIKEEENQIVEFDEFESKLIEFKKKYDDVVYESFEDRQADATLAKIEAIKQLEKIFDISLKHEKEQVELESLRGEY